MPLHREVDVVPGDIVLHGDLATPKGHSTQFLAHVCCGQMAGWMKISFGTEVGLGPGEPRSFPPKGARQPPTFRPMSIVAKRLPISAILGFYISSL